MWANQGNESSDSDNFVDVHGADIAPLARSIVRRAIDDWNAVITDQDFDNDNNPSTNNFQLRVFAGTLGATTRGETGNFVFTHGGAGQTGWTA
jgi:hypothetical protein